MPRKKDPTEIVTNSIEKTPDAYHVVPRSKGKRTGMGVSNFWVMLFELNERLPAKKKMTDEEIKRQMWMEFPDRQGVKSLGRVGEKGKNTVNFYRGLYNRGKFSGGRIPEIQSHRYNEQGQKMKPHPLAKSGDNT